MYVECVGEFADGSDCFFVSDGTGDLKPMTAEQCKEAGIAIPEKKEA